MLLLFDIDGTLLHTTGCGMASILAAGRDCFGPGFSLEDISVAGRLDPLIFADAFTKNKILDTPANHAALRAAYIPHLEQRLATTTTAVALPGAIQLLDSLAQALQANETNANNATLALLTGNFEEAAHLKLSRCGIEPTRFTFGVFGDHATLSADRQGLPPRREDLVPTALRLHKGQQPRHAAPLFPQNGKQGSHADFVIIGDTPHDVRCATAHGGRCLAVATGQYSRDALHQAGADLVVDDLTDTPALTRWLLGN